MPHHGTGWRSDEEERDFAYPLPKGTTLTPVIGAGTGLGHLPSARGIYPLHFRREAVALRDQGYTVREIAAKLGADPRRLGRRLREWREAKRDA